MAQVEQQLPSKHNVLSSKRCSAKNKVNFPHLPRESDQFILLFI
jgi:hypothetical protein